MPITCCLEEIANSSPADRNSETRSDAQSRLSFVVALVLIEKVLPYIKGLSVKFQGHYVNVIRVHKNIENVKSTDIETFTGKHMERLYCYVKA